MDALAELLWILIFKAAAFKLCKLCWSVARDGTETTEEKGE
jgi:hypothetical protein